MPLVVVFSLVLTSCFSGNKSGTPEVQEPSIKEDSSFYQHCDIKYAKGFNIENRGAFKELTVYDPWHKGKVFFKYYLVPRGASRPKEIPSHGTVVEVPVRSIAALSSTQIGILKFLGEANKITAVSLPNSIYDPQLAQKASEGAIVGVGHAQSLDFEKMVELSPDLVMVAAFMNITDQEQKLMDAGLTVGYNIEWMESSPLARAEWVKFIAAFFNKEIKAQELFEGVEHRYLALKEQVKGVRERPSILSGSNFKGIWYMPGGQSYLAQLLRDGVADYCWFQDSTRGSIPLSFEVVFEKQRDADIWFGPAQARSLKEVIDMDDRYGLFKSFKQGNVYTYTKRMLSSGANDWWESGVMHPDLVFKDVIKILHPQLLPDHELFYYKRLK